MTNRRLGGTLLLAALGLLLTASCRDEPSASLIEWHQVTWSGGNLNVAVVEPTTPLTSGAPVVVALPWGAGTGDLVQTFIQAYWLTEPAGRGYYVISPEVQGSSLFNDADELIPALMDWIDTTFDVNMDQVALVGASNGGRGIFFAALAHPDRFDAMMGLPAQYNGVPSDLSVLAGMPILLLVGETDTEWVGATASTAAALATQGIIAEVDTVRGQGHVMSLSPQALMDWIDAALGR